jgi:hypothetical protein
MDRSYIVLLRRSRPDALLSRVMPSKLIATRASDTRNCRWRASEPTHDWFDSYCPTQCEGRYCSGWRQAAVDGHAFRAPQFAQSTTQKL